MNESDAEWLKGRVQYINGLKNPSANQEALAKMYQQKQDGEFDGKHEPAFNALVKAEKLMERAEKSGGIAYKKVCGISEEERKRENKQRFVLGGLVLGVLEENSRMRQWVMQEIEKRKPDKASMEAMEPLLKKLRGMSSSGAAESTKEDEAGSPAANATINPYTRS